MTSDSPSKKSVDSMAKAEVSPKKMDGPQTDLEKTTSNNLGFVEDVPLRQLGLDSPQRKNLSAFAVIAMGWNICQSWAAVGATMAISVASGGPVTLVYGVILVFFFCGSCALSMAEIAAVYPTAGGQYHWTSILSPNKRSGRVLSYICVCLNTFGWIALASSFIITTPQMITALKNFWNPTYVIQRWHIFLIYQAFNFGFTAYNIFLSRKTIWLQDIGFFLSIAFFFIITITCLVMSNPKQPSEFVWTEFINTSGWSSDGIVFLSGLVNPNFIYSGLDGAIHLAEECSNAKVAVPRALISTVVIGFATALTFGVSMTYSYHDFDAVLGAAFPLLEIWNQATSSPVAATTFLSYIILASCFATWGALQTASRLTWSLARDDAVVGASYLSRLHPTLEVPVWALLANSFGVFVLGCIFLGSTTAFNAIVSSGLILQQLTFAMPAGLMLWRRAKGTLDQVLPKSRDAFRLPGPVGAVVNFLTVVFGGIALVFYSFPTVLPVAAGNMNYTCAVIGVMALLSVANWFGYARKQFHGPRLEEHY